MRSPILFLIFNRPDTTEQVFEAIRQARPPCLYVAADGPRANREGEKERCEITRKIATKVDWPCELKTLFRDENLGCGKAVSSAITWFFENEPEGIIIEDDILPHPDFFVYCDELLERYRDDERIQLITGRNAFFDGYKSPYSYYMSPYNHIWGWACWRRVLSTYEYDTTKLSKDEFLSKYAKRIPKKGIPYWAGIFDMMFEHRCDTWDYQLIFNQILYERYSIIPFTNLIRNIGFGDNATHTTQINVRNQQHSANSILPLIHPDGLYTDEKADMEYMKNAQLMKRTLLERVVSKLKRIFNHES